MQSGSNRANNRQPPWEPEGGAADGVSFGAWLRRQREIREIPLREITEVTKISVRYLEALEQDRFDVLPAPVFVKGFLREYSRYVGLDPDEVVNSYLTAQEATEEPDEEPPSPSDQASRSSSLLLAAGLLALLGLVAALIYFADSFRGAEERTPPPIAPPPAVASPPPAPLPAPPAETVERTPLAVTMDFTEDCWVEAVVDGERRLSELHGQGEALRIEAESEVLLTLGNPAGVRIEVNGEPFDPGVPGGRVARDIRIALDAAAGESDGATGR